MSDIKQSTSWSVSDMMTEVTSQLTTLMNFITTFAPVIRSDGGDCGTATFPGHNYLVIREQSQGETFTILSITMRAAITSLSDKIEMKFHSIGCLHMVRSQTKNKSDINPLTFYQNDISCSD